MMTTAEYPKLRPVEAFPLSVSGREGICLRDPSNLTENMVVVPHHVFEIIRLFDGRHSILDIQTAYARQYGTILFREQVEEIINRLDENLLLESDGFLRFLNGLKEEFRRSGLRKAVFAGKGYAGSGEALRRQLDDFFKSVDGTHCSTERGGDRKPGDKVKGAVLPHIDLSRGGRCFAQGYREIERSSSATCFVVLGTSHGEMKRPFTLTRKDFETPFGNLRTNKEMVAVLERYYGSRLFEDEFAHRAEHSIEFQAVFLNYLYHGRRDITIVPILCSSFHEIIHSGTSPSSVQEIGDFIGALREVVKGVGQDVLVLASADLSHVGPRFGDPLPLTAQSLREVAREDAHMIRFIEGLDSEGFFSSIQRDGDRRRICGLSSIYTLLRVIDASRGKLLKYEQWSDQMGAVSFASICFY